MIRIIICGAGGKVGQVLAAAAKSTDGVCVVAGVDKFADAAVADFPVYRAISDVDIRADVIIDFSRPEALDANIAYADKNGLKLVIATTGFSEEEVARIHDASNRVPIFFSANMSLGVNLQIELSKKAAAFLGEDYDIEIVEKHHNQKVDAPSGTALAIADGINSMFIEPKDYVYGRYTKTQRRGREIGLHAVRGGTVTGEHTVMFIGTDEVFEINHIAQSKSIFATGALRAAMFMAEKQAGLYDMNDILMQCAITNIYEDDDQAMITLLNLPCSPKMAADVFSDIASRDIKIDIIGQSCPRGDCVDLSFSMAQADIDACASLLQKYVDGHTTIVTKAALSKLTVEGAGMQRQSGVASKLFGALAKANICISIITTSNTNISFCVDAAKARDAVRIISEEFGL